jgi:hypothetical protein
MMKDAEFKVIKAEDIGHGDIVIIESKIKLSTEKVDVMRKQFENLFKGPAGGVKVAILEEGLKLSAVLHKDPDYSANGPEAEHINKG